MSNTNSTTSKLQEMYSSSPEFVRRAKLSIEDAKNSYGEYLNFLTANIELKGKNLLDVGCGNGWSTFLISEHTKNATGLDVHKDGYEPTPSPKLQYVCGSAMELPFEASSFDIVTTHECIEHVPNPQKALEEFDRVLKSGGYVAVVGPNLLSTLQSFRGMLSYVWKNKPVSSILFRHADMPRHPHGNTLPEIVTNLFKNTYSVAKLFALKKPLFKSREPDLRPPFHADSDSCYFLNPLDLKYFFESRGYEVIRISRQNLSTVGSLIPSGTWFIGKKP